MRILVVGSGGREHALVWKLAQSPLADEIFCAPGNAGIAEIAECVNIDPTNIVELADFAQETRVGLTVVGPELPLALGIVDEFLKRGLKIFGPREMAAEIEESKVFAKEFMKKYNIPSASFEVVYTPEEATEAMKRWKLPFVIKADGLAAGKGVKICKTSEDAEKAIDEIMTEKKFGKAGDRVVFEQFMEGTEASFIVISDGRRALPLVTSQDHKQLLDGGKGPNTGGMGAFSPATNISQDAYRQIMDKVINPALGGMEREGRRFQGFLYAGLMFTAEGLKVLEFNCRLGDPEAQVILPRLKTDLVMLIHAALEKDIGRVRMEWEKNAATCIVLAAEGYPDTPKKGMQIKGLEDAKKMSDAYIFHSGTKKDGEKVVVSGGRVLGVVGVGETISQSARRAYEAADKIRFEGMYFRKDIGLKALKQLKESS